MAVVGMSAQEAGGDISLLTKYEQNGAKYYDTTGKRITDMLSFFRQNGWTLMRVRLFVDPTKASSDDKGQGVIQDLEYVKALGARIKAAGFKLMLDFHYSDSWADPAKQFTPAAWVGQNDDQLNTTLYNYTRDCLQAMIDAGATPDYIQTGNEISYGMLWGAQTASASSLKKCYTTNDANWDRFTTLLKSAGKACREVCPAAKIVIHTERVAQNSAAAGIYTRLNNARVDYDVIGLSYYSYYHGYLPQLESSLNNLEQKFPNKEIMLVEVGYYHAYQGDDTKYDYSATYPITNAGQNAYTQALINTIKSHKNVQGLLWWWPEANEFGLDWTTKRVTDKWYNAGLWDNQTGRAMKAVATVGTYAGCNAATGDVNADGSIDVTDINVIINIILGNDNANYYNGRADVNDDNVVDISDINAIVGLIIGT